MIYAANSLTKEVRLVTRNAHVSEREWYESLPGWDLLFADKDGWIPWHGGGCPLPDGVLIKWRGEDGMELGPVEADEVTWTGGSQDIIAYRPIIGEPEAPEWDGEGLPPVGWRGEYSPYWHACEVVAYHKGFAVVWDAHDLEYFRTKDPSTFRLIRTAEDKAVEEMLEQVETIQGVPMSKECARALYRAGYRKHD